MELYNKLKSIVAGIEEDFDKEVEGTATEANTQRIDQGLKLMGRLMEAIKMDRAFQQL